jgi:hypothetical protein
MGAGRELRKLTMALIPIPMGSDLLRRAVASPLGSHIQTTWNGAIAGS